MKITEKAVHTLETQNKTIYPESVAFSGKSAYFRSDGKNGSYIRLNGALPLTVTVTGKFYPEEMEFYAELLSDLSCGAEVIVDGYQISKSVLYQGEAGFKAGCNLGEYIIKLGGADYE